MTKFSKGQISIELILLVMAVLLAGILVSFHMTKFTFEGDILSDVRHGAFQVFGLSTNPTIIIYSLNFSDVKISPSTNLDNAWLQINDTGNETYLWYYGDGTFKGLANTSDPTESITEDNLVILPHGGYASNIIFRSDVPTDMNWEGIPFTFTDIKKFEIIANNPDIPIKYNISHEGSPEQSNQAYLDIEADDVTIIVTKANNKVFELIANTTSGTIELLAYEP
ncbi:class III signal peptide-containing protein [Methanococcus maripaludis]|nr:class III signal peptide-containing protein [Methanococcus maripaludis]